ncbi:MAG: dihydroflavonol-4-reductase [Arenicella sp.]|jgi:dihydroflavonol-4-reductase
MKVGVTGASGHLGNVVCRFLLDQGYEVNALYNSTKKALERVNVNLFQGDLADKKSLQAFATTCEVLIHCAGLISITGGQKGLVEKINVEGVKNIIEVAIQCGVKKIIHVSSVHALIAPNRNAPMNEKHAYKTENDYAYDYSKARGEQLMLEAFNSGKIEGCVVRPSLVAGPFDFKPSEFGKALIDFRKEKIPVIPAGGYDFVDVRDVAKSIISAIAKGRNGEAYMVTGRYLSMKELTLFIKQVVGVKVPKRILPFWAMRAALPFVKVRGKIKKASPIFTIESIAALKNGHPHIDSSKAQSELGHKPMPITDSLKDFYEWHDNQREN